MSGNKQDLIERLQTSGDLLDDNDDLLDQVGLLLEFWVHKKTKIASHAFKLL